MYLFSRYYALYYIMNYEEIEEKKHDLKKKKYIYIFKYKTKKNMLPYIIIKMRPLHSFPSNIIGQKIV